MTQSSDVPETGRRRVILLRAGAILLSVATLMVLVAVGIRAQNKHQPSLSAPLEYTPALYVVPDYGTDTIAKISQLTGATLWVQHFAPKYSGYRVQIYIAAVKPGMIIVKTDEWYIHTGVAPVEPPMNPEWRGLDALTGTQLWAIPSGIDPSFGLELPFLTDTMFVTRTVADFLDAYDIRTGKQRYSLFTPGYQYAGHDAHHMYLMQCRDFTQLTCSMKAVNISDGAQVWQQAIGQDEDAAGASGGYVFVRSLGHLSVLNAATGAHVWQTNVPIPSNRDDAFQFNTYPAASGGHIIYLSLDCPARAKYCQTTTFVRDAQSGKLQGQVKHLSFDDILLTTPQQVWLLSTNSWDNQAITAVNLQNGSQAWFLDLSSGLHSDIPPLGDSFNVLATGSVVITTHLFLVGGMSTIYAYDVGSGKLVWSRALAQGMSYGGIDGGKTVVTKQGTIFASVQNTLAALDGRTGAIIWQRNVNGLQNAAVFADGAV